MDSIAAQYKLVSDKLQAAVAAGNATDFRETIVLGDVKGVDWKCLVYILKDVSWLPQIQSHDNFIPMLAEHGVLIHADSKQYRAERGGKYSDIRGWIKIASVHNGKLGFNWDAKTTMYAKVDAGQR